MVPASRRPAPPCCPPDSRLSRSTSGGRRRLAEAVPRPSTRWRWPHVQMRGLARSPAVREAARSVRLSMRRHVARASTRRRTQQRMPWQRWPPSAQGGSPLSRGWRGAHTERCAQDARAGAGAPIGRPLGMRTRGETRRRGGPRPRRPELWARPGGLPSESGPRGRGSAARR